MKIYSVGRIRALLFLGVVYSIFLIGLVQRCRGIGPEPERARHSTMKSVHR
ncbi:MAG: hypothetical protein AB7K37_12420 [Cyclobacteriaceae bacterium]